VLHTYVSCVTADGHSFCGLSKLSIVTLEAAGQARYIGTLSNSASKILGTCDLGWRAERAWRLAVGFFSSRSETEPMPAVLHTPARMPVASSPRFCVKGHVACSWSPDFAGVTLRDV